MYCIYRLLCYNINMAKIIKISIDKKLFEKFAKLRKPIPVDILTGFFRCTLAQLNDWCKDTYGITLKERIRTVSKSLKKVPPFNESNFELFTLSNQADIINDKSTYCIDRYVDFFGFSGTKELETACRDTFAGRTFRQSVDACIYYDRMDIFENLKVRRNESPNLLKHMAEVCLDLNARANENSVDTFKANAYIALNRFWDTSNTS